MSRLGLNIGLVALLTVLGPAQVAALEITNVRAEPLAFDPRKGESTRIQFRLDEPARVTLHIFDGRDLLIRSIEKKELSAGEHSLTWKGDDQAGRTIPPEAYHYTLVATNAAGRRVEHDLTDLSGGEDIQARDVRWDPEQQRIYYVLPKPGRVNIRIGLKNDGPLLRTLTDWLPREAGLQSEAWDGKDASGVLDLSKHPQRLIAVDAFALSDNTLFVRPRTDRIELIEDLQWGETRRVKKKTPQKRMHAHSQQPLESRGDFTVYLRLPEGLPKNKDGLPIVSGKVPVRLEIDEADRARALARRFEPVFFVDGTFAFENEVGFLPMTFVWDTAPANEGVHYVTANLRGYEGNFGIATTKVYVKK